MLKFSPANTKLKKLYKKRYLQKWLRGRRKVYSLDLLSGWSCPFAKDCHSKAVQTPKGRRIQDGPDCQFRCYAASQEVQYDNVYKVRKDNFDAIRKCRTQADIVKLLESSLPKNAGIVRWHSAGDFFSPKYFGAAVELAKRHPDVLFYAYTKALGYWASNFDDIPANLVLTASRGGRLDELIDTWGMRSVVVVKSGYQARKAGLPVDNDDSHAADPARRENDFALVIHGTQPKGSELGKVVAKNNRRSR